ncbi:MAG: hypothetical protein WBW53_20130 [Terriglobales bacterium]
MDRDGSSPKALAAFCGIGEADEHKRSNVIAKLVGARCEVEDVLLSRSGTAVLLEQERTRLSQMMGAIDDIVRRIEDC